MTCSVLNESIVQIRLKPHPEMLARLEEFLVMRKLVGKPALVVQARPVDSAPPGILHDSKVLARFREGGSDRHGWWEGFASDYALQPCFHGLASVSNPSQPTWASELHYDGHFIAGTWDFLNPPYVSEGRIAVADFFDELFGDFFSLVAKTLGNEGVPYLFTATIAEASALHFVSESDFGRNLVERSPPLGMKCLQWPVFKADVGSENYRAVGLRMAEGLCGAYGYRRRK